MKYKLYYFYLFKENFVFYIEKYIKIHFRYTTRSHFVGCTFIGSTKLVWPTHMEKQVSS